MEHNELDATGLLCPLPVLKLRKRLSTLKAAEHLLMHADDPAAIIDVPHFCAETGHTLVEVKDHGNWQSYLVQKKP